MKISKLATRLALLLAAPLIMIASLFELIGTLSSNPTLDERGIRRYVDVHSVNLWEAT